MSALATTLFWALMAFFLVQAVMAWGFVRKLYRWKPAPSAQPDCPKTAVVLCLRGGDPFLSNCLEALLQQDYPRYDVRVIIDGEGDPAARVVEACIGRLGASNIQVDYLRDRRETCSLKCSSLVQAVAQLDDSYEIVALLDADTVPHPGWLRELVAPLQDEQVGGTTGNRWYMPETPSLGAIVRYCWNASAIIQMYWYGIAWGGTLALKMQIVRELGLLERWGNAFCEDTMLYRILRKKGLRVAFVPSLMMVNREECTTGDFLRWMRRQLLTARLYHPRWPAVVLHGVLTALVSLAVIGVTAVALLSGQWAAAAWAGGAMALYLLLMLSMLWPMERAVRRMVAARDEPTGWMSARVFARLPWAALLLQFFYPLVLGSALLLREVAWRGVRYRIDGPWKIRLLKYRPYGSRDGQSTTSL